MACALSLPSVIVAPSAGAWIETHICKECVNAYQVAPSAGAWIETKIKKDDPHEEKSPPVRGRGLKHLISVYLPNLLCRPQCGGVD